MGGKLNDEQTTGYLLIGAEILLGIIIIDPNSDATTKGTALGALVGVLTGKVSASTPKSAS